MDLMQRVRRLADREDWQRGQVVRVLAARCDLRLADAAGERRELHPEAARALLAYMETIEERLDELEDENRTGVPPASRP